MADSPVLMSSPLRQNWVHAQRLADYWVLASNEPITADSLDEARATPGVTAVHVSGQAGRPSVVRLPDGTTARHIRVQLAHQANPLSLAEVRVRGVPPT